MPTEPWGWAIPKQCIKKQEINRIQIIRTLKKACVETGEGSLKERKGIRGGKQALAGGE